MDIVKVCGKYGDAELWAKVAQDPSHTTRLSIKPNFETYSGLMYFEYLNRNQESSRVAT